MCHWGPFVIGGHVSLRAMCHWGSCVTVLVTCRSKRVDDNWDPRQVCDRGHPLPAPGSPPTGGPLPADRRGPVLHRHFPRSVPAAGVLQQALSHCNHAMPPAQVGRSCDDCWPAQLSDMRPVMYAFGIATCATNPHTTAAFVGSSRTTLSPCAPCPRANASLAAKGYQRFCVCSSSASDRCQVGLSPVRLVSLNDTCLSMTHVSQRHMPLRDTCPSMTHVPQ